MKSTAALDMEQPLGNSLSGHFRQMAQFALNLLQSVYTSLYSPYPKFISHILFVYMISLLGLFGHFYWQKHIAGAKARKAKMK